MTMTRPGRHIFSVFNSYRVFKMSFVLFSAFLVYMILLHRNNFQQWISHIQDITAMGKPPLMNVILEKPPMNKAGENYPLTSKEVMVEKEKTLLKNITSIAHRLFFTIEDEPYLLKNAGYFKPKKSVNNGLKHIFLLNSDSVCQGDSLFLLILIPSVVQDVKRRNAIRQTWMKAAENKRWHSQPITKNVRHVFFTGRRAGFIDGGLNAMRGESEKYKDIVFADLVDSYQNLSRKMVTALQWVDKYCPNAKYVLKCDQDTFVNVPLILALLGSMEHGVTEQPFVLGRIHVKPRVQRKGRWAVSKSDYPMPLFPLYMYGHTYILSASAIPKLVSVANRVRLVGPEDVFITGILPKVVGVTRLHAESFTVCCRAVYDCEVVWNHYVSMTTLRKPEDHYRLWDSVSKGQCNPKVMFNYQQRMNSKLLRMIKKIKH